MQVVETKTHVFLYKNEKENSSKSLAGLEENMLQFSLLGESTGTEHDNEYYHKCTTVDSNC